MVQGDSISNSFLSFTAVTVKFVKLIQFSTKFLYLLLATLAADLFYSDASVMLSCGSATQLTFVTLAQARAFSPASFCAFHNPLERLDSSCWKRSVFGKYNLYCFALP